MSFGQPSILVDHDGHARLTDFEFASIIRGMNSATQVNGYAAAWTAPEILEGTDAITREADVFAFGMAVIEVGLPTLPSPASGVEGWMICLMSKSYPRFLQEGLRSVNPRLRSLSRR